MQAILSELGALMGVNGSFVCDRDGGLVGRAMPEGTTDGLEDLWQAEAGFCIGPLSTVVGVEQLLEGTGAPADGSLVRGPGGDALEGRQRDLASGRRHEDDTIRIRGVIP